MAKGVCSYSESLHDMFTRKCREFHFRSCPYISDSTLKSYRLSNVLAISGPSRSGKTSLVSHIIFDLITTRGLNAKIVYIDTDLGFDFETLKSKFDSSAKNDQESSLDSSLSNLIYLPVLNSDQLAVILQSLEICLIKKTLPVHALVLDSATNLSRIGSSENMMSSRNKAIEKNLSQIVDLCKRHSIFLIYTIDIENYLNRRDFIVRLKISNKNKPEMDFLTVSYTPEESQLSPIHMSPKDTFQENILSNDLLLTFESNNSNDYKSPIVEFDSVYENEGTQEYGNSGQSSQGSSNQITLKSFVPEFWISKEPGDSSKDLMLLIVSISRRLDKNYMTFISRDCRKNKESTDSGRCKDEGTIITKKEQNEYGKFDLNREGYDKRDSNPPTSIEQGVSEGQNVINLQICQQKRCLNGGINSDVVCKHDFRVYRLDSPTTYTECSYELSFED